MKCSSMALLATLVLSFPLAAGAQNTALVMDSDPGAIGGGQDYYLTPADGTFRSRITTG